MVKGIFERRFIVGDHVAAWWGRSWEIFDLAPLTTGWEAFRTFEGDQIPQSRTKRSGSDVSKET